MKKIMFVCSMLLCHAIHASEKPCDTHFLTLRASEKNYDLWKEGEFTLVRSSETHSTRVSIEMESSKALCALAIIATNAVTKLIEEDRPDHVLITTNGRLTGSDVHALNVTLISPKKKQAYHVNLTSRPLPTEKIDSAELSNSISSFDSASNSE